MTKKQKRLFREYGVTSTPSVYVNGKYRDTVENSAFQADRVEAFRKIYVAAVMAVVWVAGCCSYETTGANSLSL
ncbi:hypothetical protein [Escherichia coli]|uniref:hypothetical protein n=1 Tax=Escherichia coli TaxID=562 RepID=UPI0020281BD1|nr:hypothetical protein [Escherichia coli]